MMIADDPESQRQVPCEQTVCLMCGGDDTTTIARGKDWLYDTSDQTFYFVGCKGCGHVYLNPRPKIEAASTIYPETYYTVSGEHSTGAFNLLGRIKDVVVTRRIRSLLEHLPEGSHVLEVGCGDGSLLLAVRKVRPDLQLVGLDFAIAAGHRSQFDHAGIRWIESTLEDAELSETFSLVVMNQLIEHLWDVGGGLEKIRTTLGEDGLLSISTPNLDGWDRRFFATGTWGGYYFPRHMNLFSSESLAALLENAGFEVVARRSLLAPLVGMNSLRASLKKHGWRSSRWFADTNVPVLFLLAFVDRTMSAFGLQTSNQQIIVKRRV